MEEFVKYILKFIGNNIHELRKRNSLIRKLVLYYRFSRRQLRIILFKHFMFVVTIVFFGLCTYIFYHPNIIFKDACYMAKLDYNRIQKIDSERDCQSNSVIAIAWDNFNQSQIKVSMLINNSVLWKGQEKDRWSEVYIPSKRPSEPVENIYVSHRWDIISKNEYLDFHVGSCDTGDFVAPDGTHPTIEARVGIALRSSEPRPFNNRLTKEEINKCNS